VAEDPGDHGPALADTTVPAEAHDGNWHDRAVNVAPGIAEELLRWLASLLSKRGSEKSSHPVGYACGRSPVPGPGRPG